MVLSEAQESSASVDEKLLLFMEQLQILEEKRAAVNSLIEHGWFSMSKARYSMGNKQVCSLQYASDIEPLVCVHVRSHDSGEVEFCTESGDDVRSVVDIGPQEEGIRRRNKPKDVVAEKEESDEVGSEKATVKKNEQDPRQDPLRWFGILVPQSLKQAQAAFKQAIELSAEVATLQTSVLKSRQELKDGLRQKQVDAVSQS
ncbi:coiled-coil domain-containing protein 115 isoform X1 [Solea solea]|uniref:coiled-coil domain-containing protein 115 isoform X1 n=1 Tax=Solea solea TaxID=90069 RepID=UPI00272BA28D|nr:coiled-coil domain-containing protein 115 isoform X1 [Solea solea]